MFCVTTEKEGEGGGPPSKSGEHLEHLSNMMASLHITLAAILCGSAAAVDECATLPPSLCSAGTPAGLAGKA